MPPPVLYDLHVTAESYTVQVNNKIISELRKYTDEI